MKSRASGTTERAWMSRAEVARLLEVAPVTVGRWASAGKLPYGMTLGGRRRFRRQDIEAIAQRLGQPRPASDTPEPRRAR